MMEKSAFLELFDTGSLLLVRAYNTREFHDFDWVDEAVNHTVGLGLYFPQSIDKNPIANPIVSALMQLAQWRRREDRLELKHLILIEKAWEYYKNQERDGSSVAVAEPLRLSGYMKTGTQSGINRDPRG